ncbi:MAG: MaoC/PaaZ C-terminal domain-containing protein [Planctomycetota bacterium]
MASKTTKDVRQGDTHRTSNFEITREGAAAYAAQFDPQPMHLNDDAAEGSFFGEFTASGWYTLSLTMKLMVESRPFGDTPLVGMRVDDIRFSRPVTPGMVLHAESEVEDIRVSASHADRGYVSLHVRTMTENGEEVLRQRWIVLLPA